MILLFKNNSCLLQIQLIKQKMKRIKIIKIYKIFKIFKSNNKIVNKFKMKFKNRLLSKIIQRRLMKSLKFKIYLMMIIYKKDNLKKIKIKNNKLLSHN